MGMACPGVWVPQDLELWDRRSRGMVSSKGKKQMIPLLKLAIEAHGGLERWREVHGIDLKLRIGGGLWQLKGLSQGLVDVALHIETAHRLGGIPPFCPEGGAGESYPYDRGR